MMSRRRHTPPGHGLGKLICCSYCTSPLRPPASSPFSMRMGVARRAEATSVSRPETFFHHAVFLVPPGQYAS